MNFLFFFVENAGRSGMGKSNLSPRILIKAEKELKTVKIKFFSKELIGDWKNKQKMMALKMFAKKKI